MHLKPLRRSMFSAGVGFAATLFLAGCGGGGDAGTGTETGHEGHDHAQQGDEIAQALAALPAEDRAQAEKQKACPISGEDLGSMGTPVKVALDGGKSVLLCCKGCEDEAKEDPEATLAKVEDLVKQGGGDTQ